jgi:hypothetical protein
MVKPIDFKAKANDDRPAENKYPVDDIDILYLIFIRCQLHEQVSHNCRQREHHEGDDDPDTVYKF